MTETAVNPAYARIHRGQCREVPLGAGTQKGRNRELVMPSSGTGKVFLKYKDTRFTWYSLPLGKAATRGRDEAPTPEKNVLVPVLPRVYTTPDLDPARCAVPRAPGWLYIFKGGYLWRELEVLPQGRFRDVNLHEYAGRDVRPATVEKDERIFLPYRLDDEEQDIRMAYADVQWSWARINMLGGMDPDDFRLHPDHLPPMPEDQGYTQAQIAEQQEARLQQIDLSGFDAGFPVQPPEGRKARVENVEHANDELIHIRLHRKANIPVVYLHDPLGVALNNIEMWWAVWAGLKRLLEGISRKAHHKSAALAQQAFFNERLWKTKAARKPRADASGYWSGGEMSTGYEDTSDFARLLRKAAEELDGEEIRNLLQVDDRKALRARLREIKAIHVAWLEGEQDGKPLRETHPDFVDFNAAVLDYAWLPAPSYARLWAVMGSVTGFLAHDPTALDGALDLPEDREQTPSGEDPGRRYLASLLDPAHPLHAVLFPSRAQVDETDADWMPNPEQPEPPDAEGLFRPNAFAAALAPSLAGYGLQRYADDSVKLGEQIVSDFMLVLGRQKEALAKVGRTVEVGALLRLAKAANHPRLPGLRLVNAGDVVRDSEVVLGMRISLVEEQISTRAAAGSMVRGGLKKTVALKDAGGAVVGYLSPENVPRFAGLRPAISPQEFDDLFVAREGDVVKARVELVVARGEASPLLREYYLPGSTDSAAARAGAGALRASGKVLPPMVAVMEVINLGNTVARVNISFKSKVEAVVAFLAFVQATTQAAVAIGGEERVATALSRGLGRLGGAVDRAMGKTGGYYRNLLGKVGEKAVRGRFVFRFVGKPMQVSNLTAAGAFLAGAGAVMAVWDAVNLALVDDDDAAAWSVANAVALTGFGVALVIQTGAAFLGMGPVAWAFLALAMVTAMMVSLAMDTPLEKWTKHGPFAKTVEDRLTQEYEGASEHEVYQQLLGLLQPVRVTLLKDPGVVPAGVMLEVAAPGFVPGKDVLDVRVLAERWWVNAHGQGGRRLDGQWLSPQTIKRWEDEETGALLGYRYYYRLPEAKRVVVRACARRQTADGANLPPPAIGRQPAQTGETVGDEMEGWAVAEPLRVRER